MKQFIKQIPQEHKSAGNNVCNLLYASNANFSILANLLKNHNESYYFSNNFVLDVP